MIGGTTGRGRARSGVQLFATAFMLAACCLVVSGCCLFGFIGHCPPEAGYCCLQYDLGSVLATYCNNHSSPVGVYTAGLNSDSARSVWLAVFSHFLDRIDDCGDPDCIRDSIIASPLDGFIIEYDREHADAEAALIVHPEISLTTDERASLIRCGFRDALERVTALREWE